MPKIEQNPQTQSELRISAFMAVRRVISDANEIKEFATKAALNLSGDGVVLEDDTAWRFTAIKTRLESATIAAKEAIASYTEYCEKSTVPEEKRAD